MQACYTQLHVKQLFVIESNRIWFVSTFNPFGQRPESKTLKGSVRVTRGQKKKRRDIKEYAERKNLFGGSGFITMPHTDTDRFDNVLNKNYLKAVQGNQPEASSQPVRKLEKADPIQPVAQGTTDEELAKATVVSPEPTSFEAEAQKHKKKPKSVQKNWDVDFSFLLDGFEPELSEEDEQLNEIFAKAELMIEFKDVISVPIVSECILKSLKKKLTEFPDIVGNEDNPDRKAFVNVFNILKQIIRKG